MVDVQYRDMFEKYIKENFDPTLFSLAREGEYYLSDRVEDMWVGWEAALKTTKVVVPEWDEYDTPRQAIEAFCEALNVSGVSFESKR